MLMSCSGEGPPKITAGRGTLHVLRVVVGEIILVQHDVAVGEGGPHPLHRLARACGVRWTRMSRWAAPAISALRLVWPTITRSVAASSAATANSRFSVELQRPELDHARRHHHRPGAPLGQPVARSASDDAALAGFDENVLSMTTTPLALRLDLLAVLGARAACRAGARAAATSRPRATHDAEGAGHVGRLGGAGLRCGAGAPATHTSRLPSPSSSTTTSAAGDVGGSVATRTTRLPRAGSRVGQRGQAVGAHVEHRRLHALGDLGLGLHDAVERAASARGARARCSRSRRCRAAPTRTSSGSRPARRCPSRPRTPRCPGARCSFSVRDRPPVLLKLAGLASTRALRRRRGGARRASSSSCRTSR